MGQRGVEERGASGASLGWVQKALYELGQDTHRVPGVEEMLGHLLVGWVISEWDSWISKIQTKMAKQTAWVLFRSRCCGPETFTVWVSLEDKEHTPTSFLKI